MKNNEKSQENLAQKSAQESSQKSQENLDHKSQENLEQKSQENLEQKSQEKSALNWRVLKRLASYIMAYKMQVFVVIVSIIVSSIVQAVSAMFLQSLVDAYILPLIGKRNPDFAPLLRMIAIMACVCAIGVFFSWLWSRLVVKIAQSVMRNLRNQMFKHHQDLPLGYLDAHGYGDVMSRYTNDTEALHEAISWSFPDSFSALMSIAAAFCAIVWLSIPVAIFIVIFTAILLLLVRFMLKRSGKLFVQFQAALGDLNEFVEEADSGRKVIKIFNHERAAVKKLSDLASRVQKISASANSYANNVMPVISNASYLFYVLLAIFGAWAVNAGVPSAGLSGVFGVNSSTLTIGTLISLLTLSRAFINPIGEITMQLNSLMMAAAGANRIFALLDEPVEKDDGTVKLVKIRAKIVEFCSGDSGDNSNKSQVDFTDAKQSYLQVFSEVSEDSCGNNVYWAWKNCSEKSSCDSSNCDSSSYDSSSCDYSNPDSSSYDSCTDAQKHAICSKDGVYTLVRGDVRFENVTFGYEPSKTVLHNISWYAHAGQKVALVGATGAGKTTIANLLTRFYNIADGQILYDGIDVRNICKSDLRHAVATVLQDVGLFSASIMDNIRYGRLNASDSDCVAAATLAHADSFISKLPDGYNTHIKNGGAELSQGQKQLIAIARAAVANPPVLILDEATSSIDTHTEALVQSAMDALMQDRTVFVIAHRLSTVRNADVIMVLDHGRIVERGSHEDLMKKRGEYYQLCTGAMELE
ncbi:Rrf2 family transcriptional regulator [Gardnerella vaginalis]|uniref:ABC transporter ATP-binding protein/permease n=1 Tax=Gardnerella piotii TaxID=2792977 RepID=A0ABU5MRJ9_9BIFI|nr:ABC transporter ATP-binding protein [Gardnerella piotii]MDZ7545063.1 ABC transporter ATP-binding protein/permease [Gardnerella piotii]MDZ7552694.1 ABC transporter ATP-binding protein/permease [Gardnerella piotii]RFT26503.1 Rrf2 family transcriptional regulator [Gardnerella vaginalis]